MGFMLLAGGFLVIIFAVVVSVVLWFLPWRRTRI